MYACRLYNDDGGGCQIYIPKANPKDVYINEVSYTPNHNKGTTHTLWCNTGRYPGSCLSLLTVIFWACSEVPSFAFIQSKCEKYWCDEMNEPLEMADRGFTVTVTGRKVYADYEIRDMTIRCVSVQAAAMRVHDTMRHQLCVVHDYLLSSIRLVTRPLSLSN